MLHGMGRQPHWPLEDVRRLAAEDRLALTLSACDVFESRVDARGWIRELIATLRPENFAHSIQLAVHTADIYGAYSVGHGWYLKFTMTRGTDGLAVLVISCHPVEHPLETLRGTIAP